MTKQKVCMLCLILFRQKWLLRAIKRYLMLLSTWAVEYTKYLVRFWRQILPPCYAVSHPRHGRGIQMGLSLSSVITNDFAIVSITCAMAVLKYPWRCPKELFWKIWNTLGFNTTPILFSVKVVKKGFLPLCLLSTWTWKGINTSFWRLRVLFGSRDIENYVSHWASCRLVLLVLGRVR